MKRLYSITILLVLTISTLAQQATVTFISDKDCEILVYKPIDGGYNDKVPTKRLIASPLSPTVYKTEATSYMFLLCEFPQYQNSCSLLIFPNDSVEVNLSKEGIVFHGENQAAQQYYYDNYEEHPNLDKCLKMQKVFKEYLEGKRGLSSIIPAIDDSLQISSQIKTIKELPSNTNTTKACSEVFQKEIRMFINTEFISLFDLLLSQNQESKHLTYKDSIQVRQIIDSIYEEIPVSYELLRYPSNIYAWKYFGIYYKNKEYPKEDEASIFGPYKKYLFASEEMQPTLLGHACMVQLKYNTDEMNLNGVKRFFNEKFPHSEYTTIINERIKEENDSTDERTGHALFIEDKIDSLAQLKKIPELKGKYLYIDLWASWCMPCRGEFSYKQQVHQIVDSYNNVATLYISIDHEKQEKAWRNCIKHYKLEGYHLRASSLLQQDIQRKVYGTDRYDIPRYVLISPTGVILHKDLPRPSEYPKLKEALEHIIQ